MFYYEPYGQYHTPDMTEKMSRKEMETEAYYQEREYWRDYENALDNSYAMNDYMINRDDYSPYF